MKAKFTLGFLTGFKNVPDAWPGSRYTIPILESAMAMASDTGGDPYTITPVKTLIFECRKIDDDKAAVFELLEVR